MPNINRGNLLAWNVVNMYMTDEGFRDYVLKTAWITRQQIDKTLVNYANAVFLKYLRVQGFRVGSKSILSASYTVMKNSLNRGMTNYPEVAAVIVALWASHEHELVTILQRACIQNEIAIPDNWGWEDGIVGCLDMNNIGDIIALITPLASDDEFTEWKYNLAAVWLSGGLVQKNNQFNHQTTVTSEIVLSDYIMPVDDEDVLDSSGMNLSGLREQIDSHIEKIQERQTRIQEISQEITDNIQNDSADEVINRVGELQKKAEGYRKRLKHLTEVIYQTIPFIKNELSERPDLSVNYITFIDTVEQPITISIAKEFAQILIQIEEYDKKRYEVLTECHQWSDKIFMLSSQLKDDTPQSISSTEFDLAKTSISLKSANERLETLRHDYIILEKRLAIKIGNLVSRILEIKSTIEKVSFPLPTAKEFSWDDITIDTLSQKDAAQLEEILFQIDSLLVQQKSMPQIGMLDVDDLDNQDKFLFLLNELAQRQLDVELCLLLLTGYCSQSRNFELDLSDVVIDSLLRAINQLNDGDSKFAFFAQIAPALLRKWTTTDSISCAKIHLMMIGAIYSPIGLRQDALWQFKEQQWSLANTPNWAKLWERLLLKGEDEPLPQLINLIPYQSTLNDIHKMVERNFIKENGRYMRSATIKSRHASMLANILIPLLEQQFLGFVQLREKFEQIPDGLFSQQSSKLLEQAKKQLNFFAKSNLDTIYDDAIEKEGIRDDHTFLREKANNIFFDIVNDVKQYADALIEWMALQIKHVDDLTPEKLLSEMSRFAKLEELAQSVVNEMELSIYHPNPQTIDPLEMARSYLLSKLLGDSNYIMRFPNLVAELTCADSEFSDWAYKLFVDITQKRTINEIASCLIEGDAINQVLQIANLPIDIQELAQNKQADIQNSVSQLKEELMAYGGKIDDLQILVQLGRWQLLRLEINNRIEKYKSQEKSQKQDFKRRLSGIFKEVTELKTMVLNNTEMPVVVKQEINKGLNMIEGSVISETPFDGIEDFFIDVRYRIEYKAWTLIDIQNSVLQLEASAQGNSTHTPERRSAKTVLALLEQEDVKSLGFTSGQIEASAISTRASLLENWLKLKNIQSVHTQEMKDEDKKAIYTLYRYFAQMNKLEEVKDIGDKMHLRDESVTPYGLYELIFPKTSALETSCVLITLPGEKIKPKHRQVLQDLIERKDWLPDYFVMIFIPGCTPELKSTLENEYHQKGVIVIDESTLLDLVLAETKDRNSPLGKLRSLMLNSKPLQSIDIFKINQLVDTKRSIFVGRDNYIDKIVVNSENYAIYGGRRIGKSSVLMAIRERLTKRDFLAVYFSFEGKNSSDNAIAVALAYELKLPNVKDIDSFEESIQSYLNADSSRRIAILLDEIDKYIESNPKRHLLIERLRNISQQFTGRFRVIVSGFMYLYKCIKGGGPYTPTSDPWTRMFNDIRLPNLQAESAEKIVHQGFIEILGWSFKHHAIPQRIVERTGGHPAFVQKFCEKLQQHIAKRGDKIVKVDDLDVVFNDRNPEDSFIAYVDKTLEMNLDIITRYILLFFVTLNPKTRVFPLEYLQQVEQSIPEHRLRESIESLVATSVIHKIQGGLYEFSVPDYPRILSQLGDIKVRWDELEKSAKAILGGA